MAGFETSLENIRKWLPSLLKGQTEVGLFPDVAGINAQYQPPRTSQQKAEMLRSMISAKINENKQGNALGPNIMGIPVKQPISETPASPTQDDTLERMKRNEMGNINTPNAQVKKVAAGAGVTSIPAATSPAGAIGITKEFAERFGIPTEGAIAKSGGTYTNSPFVGGIGGRPLYIKEPEASSAATGSTAGSTAGEIGALASRLYERMPTTGPSMETLQLQKDIDRGWYQGKEKEAAALLAASVESDKARQVTEGAAFRDYADNLGRAHESDTMLRKALGELGIEGGKLGLEKQKLAADQAYKDANVQKVLAEINKLGAEQAKLGRETAALPGSLDEMKELAGLKSPGLGVLGKIAGAYKTKDQEGNEVFDSPRFIEDLPKLTAALGLGGTPEAAAKKERKLPTF